MLVRDLIAVLQQQNMESHAAIVDKAGNLIAITGIEGSDVDVGGDSYIPLSDLTSQ
jgi:hypothetical protein